MLLRAAFFPGLHRDSCDACDAQAQLAAGLADAHLEHPNRGQMAAENLSGFSEGA